MKKFRKLVIVIRWILFLLMLYGVYHETGPYTTLSLLSVFIALETAE